MHKPGAKIICFSVLKPKTNPKLAADLKQLGLLQEKISVQTIYYLIFTQHLNVQKALYVHCKVGQYCIILSVLQTEG